jgi:phosphate transport system substrate-binding protein
MRFAVVTLLLVAVACAGDRDPDRGTGGKVTLEASGATFQRAAQEVAIEAFRSSGNRRIRIHYGAGGSGKGRQDFADHVVDFACTDAPYPPGERARIRDELFYIPTVLGAIVVAFNLPGVEHLQLSPDTIAKIFQRDVRRWDDPAIVADNPGVRLPDSAIVVVRRADGSGTTENFTRYLAAATRAWKGRPGSTVDWPAGTQAGHGNGGVTHVVATTEGAIGYVDLSDARAAELAYAAIRNRAGHYVAPTAASVEAAAASIELDDDLLFSALDAPGDAAYPITAQSWCIVRAEQTDRARGAALVAYFRFLLTDGQTLLADIDYAPLPPHVQRRALEQIDRIRVPRCRCAIGSSAARPGQESLRVAMQRARCSWEEMEERGRMPRFDGARSWPRRSCSSSSARSGPP